MTAPVLLIADDSDVIRFALRASLEELDYAVVEAADGDQAVAAAAEHRPDLILLDMEMPGRDGLGVLAALRDDPELRDFPVIVLSGRADVESVASALRAGAHDYMVKPVQDAELAARVAGALRVNAELADLRRRNAELTAFAWRASHDLKSPLAAIRGMADTILAYPDRLDDKTKTDLLERISAASEQAADLVGSLLALARETERKPGAEDFTLDPEAVVRAVIDQARLPDAEFDVAHADWSPVAVPASEFASVVQNIVVNASFYGRGPDGVLRLRVEGEPVDGGLRLLFTDQGPGVDPDAAPRLFDPFVRGRDSRTMNPRSSGIGLAIVRRIVERWGGAIELAPSEAGACFALTVPRATVEDRPE